MPKTRTRQLNNLWINRKQAGLGQKSVARLLGHRSRSVISEYEAGRLLPSLPTALKLAVLYNRPITELYPTLYRQAQAEVEISRLKGPFSSNHSRTNATTI